MMDQLTLGEESLANWVGRSKVIDSIKRLPGDASNRRYYRVLSQTLYKEESFIVMRMEPFVDVGDALPFLGVQRHLLSCGIDVPKVYEVDPARGFILLEDLGDITLLHRLQEISSADTERHLYEKVINALIELQVNASPKKPEKKSEEKPEKPEKPEIPEAHETRNSDTSPSIDAFKLRFDYEKLMWEVNFTIENFYQLYLKRSITDTDSEILQEGFGDICEILAGQPTVLTHRDFHSRNIMLTNWPEGPRIVMIDFQDARMGPAAYDLASLLRDSYYQLEEEQISFLIDFYIARWEARSGRVLNKNQFIRIFDLMSVQRNFKAIGSFASFLNRRGDATYLKYIGNTFENIRRTLLKYPEYANLREVLFHYYYF